MLPYFDKEPLCPVCRNLPSFASLNLQIIGSGNNIRAEQTPRVNVPTAVDGERREPTVAHMNIGTVVALAAFGTLTFLIAIITTIVILVRR